MARIIKPDGTEIEVNPKNGTDFSLEELQAIVEGYIEPIYFEHGVMVVNEEGFMKNLKPNWKASEMARQIIVGNVLLCANNQIK